MKKSCSSLVGREQDDSNRNICILCELNLFEISFEGKYAGTLPNGVGVGMSMKELEDIDDTLKYDDDDEMFVSENGYWIIDDIDSGKVKTITIFLEDVNSDDFFDYEWVNKYL